ncbi:Ku protein [Streptomyces sp. NPDC059893]|uniref:Ku protein n=1 Tax=Streptomyces sp. NPDC059893 TaxID=3346990 RepID=UPI00365E1767
MRALWSGVIQFGLVVLPVKLFSATEEHRVRLREIHAADGGRVQHRRFCEAEGREIGYEEVGRGWELPDGQLVPLTDQDLERLPLATRHVVEVLGFRAGAGHRSDLVQQAVLRRPRRPSGRMSPGSRSSSCHSSVWRTSMPWRGATGRSVPGNGQQPCTRRPARCARALRRAATWPRPPRSPTGSWSSPRY